MTPRSTPALVPVTVSFGSPRRSVEGRLVAAEAEAARVELVEAPPVELVAGVGVTLCPPGRNLELVGLVERVEGTRLDVAVSRTGHREDRWSPREQGVLRFRHAAAPAGLDPRAWALGEPSPPLAWVTPDPRVELGLDGLAFLSATPLEGTLLLAFVPPGSAEAHRVVAEVVRVDPTRREGVHRVAVRLSFVPERSGVALADMLLALQDAALEMHRGTSTLDLPAAALDVAQPME